MLVLDDQMYKLDVSEGSVTLEGLAKGRHNVTMFLVSSGDNMYTGTLPITTVFNVL
jgi:hypothetical protein